MWRVVLTWRERDADTNSVYDCARTLIYDRIIDADRRYADLDRLIRDEAWRPNLRAYDVQIDRPEPVKARAAA